MYGNSIPRTPEEIRDRIVSTELSELDRKCYARIESVRNLLGYGKTG